MLHVLLLEPDAQLAVVYARALKRAEYAVTVVKTAQAAIHALDEQSFDVIVMELNLVGHNGVEFLYELRSYSDWQNLPVIILSNQDPDIMNNKVLMQHIKINTFLYKPTTKLHTIVQAVQDVSARVV